jgi:trimethyllysine dioxygenase
VKIDNEVDLRSSTVRKAEQERIQCNRYFDLSAKENPITGSLTDSRPGSNAFKTDKGGISVAGPRVPSNKLYISDISGRWLRDSCTCSQCRNQDTAQKQFNVLRCPPGAVTIANVELASPNENDSGPVRITFQDGHESLLSAESISGRLAKQTAHRHEGVIPERTWTKKIALQPPSVQYESIESGTGMADLLLKIRIYGFAFVDSMPATPEASQSLLESIGPIRNTHYGGFYDFTSDLSSKDTAYTAEALEPHTDNTYFTEPAGLQALHMLSHTDGSGGESSLVDGFQAALQLFRSDPQAYSILSTTGVRAHASGNEGISIEPAQAFPTFTHSTELHKLIQVRWNNADRIGPAIAWKDLDRWYDAAAKFDAFLNDEQNMYWFQLKPGRMLLFDNWRVLHGRAAFTGKRRMCGGYINRDDWISKFKVTNKALFESGGEQGSKQSAPADTKAERPEEIST